MTKKELKANIAYLEKNDFTFNGEAWEEMPLSAELENYTDAGGDMIILLDELSKKSLKRYAENFDISQEVALWWPDGVKGEGVPFSNIKEHYEDLEKWVEDLKAVADGMPY